jgi:hypothetical protein
MAGYIGTKAVSLSTTGADIAGDADVSGALDVGGAFTSQGIDDNATSTAMTLDATGNVGIGTSSVTYGAANRTVLQVESSSNALVNITDGTNGFYLHQKGGTSGVDLFNTANGYMRFATNNSERMRIDNQGYVTMPYQPSFQAKAGGGWSSNIAQDTFYKLPFATNVFNTGGHYSASSYNFTAPVSGKYLFIFNVYAEHNNTGDNSDYFSVRFGVNGSTQSYHSINGYQNQGDDDTTTSQSTILSLAQNDTVQVYIRGHGTTVRYYGSNCYFFGQFLG